MTENESGGVFVPPGCINFMGKICLNDYECYVQYIQDEQKYENLWNQVPGDSDYKVTFGKQVVRVSGVMLVDKEGKPRKVEDIKKDMEVRLSYLKDRGNTGICVEQLEKYLTEI